MRLLFSISDFCISKEDIPIEIADKILKYFVEPLTIVQENAPFKIFVSYSTPGQPSGYRPYKYEKRKGRNGTSQHTFGERPEGVLQHVKGAVDLTAEDFEENKDKLIDLILEHTDFLRIAIYKTFCI
jgi:hypothetical protein